MYEFGNILGRAVTGGGGDLPSAMALAVDRGSNRLVGAGYAYDVLGNLVEMPSGASGVFMSYLDQGHFGTLTDAAGVVWKYYYDADGKRRIKSKTVNGVSSITDNCSYYFYEGEDLICQQDIGALVQDESQYEPKFLLLDHLGSTRAELVFDPVSLAPQIQEYYDLMPYGEVIDPPTTQESVLFTGKPRDSESKLDAFGSRFFDNSSLRWASPDQIFADNSISDPSSWNLYSYVRLNPVIWLDPTGKKLKSSEIETLRSIAGEDYAALINDEDDDGYIDSLHITDLDLMTNEGVSLINDLINSDKSYCYEEDGFIQTLAGPRQTRGDVENLDNNPDWRYSRGKTEIDRPPAGVDAMVVLDPGIRRLDETRRMSVTKTAIAFHELAEAYAKIEFGVPRSFDPRSVMDVGRQSAHQYAIDREKILMFQRPSVSEAAAGGNNLQRPQR